MASKWFGLLLLLSQALALVASLATYSNRFNAVLTPITTSVWGIERPFIWNNIDVGSRATVMRINDDTLVVHSPVEMDDSLRNILATLGEISVVISPNYEHLKYAQAWSEEYPTAIKVGPAGLAGKIPTITWQVLPGDGTQSSEMKSFRESIEIIHWNCEEFLDSFWNYPETNLPNYYGRENVGKIHLCSKVSLPFQVIDDGNNAEANKAWYDVEVPFGTKMWTAGMNRLYKPFYQRIMVGRTGIRRERYKQIVDQVLGLDIETIVPCHGDVIRGQELCREVLTNHFDERK